MNTKLYVLGAVLGAAPGLLPVVTAPPVASTQESRQDSRGASRKGRGGPAKGASAPVPQAGVTPPPDAKDALESQGVVPDEGRTRGGGPHEAPRHPCQAITIIQVPCDAARETCEYTYWHCPEAVNPLRA
ncbi:hypothetical protein [Corallococcus macrosporus]|uniref:Lipoprotein n=1 Tax=Myxococcus fulvus (strain ATCC BAA-855 / HW-1) TaxID=483219 RepID=F8CEH9_MYXFH|nr:hypothetical protein [Corallococcus macrosporus]AEI64849.1 hypothetical protein LILAB_14720 [Corallococcus macrosporus]